jgi:ribose/xylose/arabinose/galactoside ABC-type transport system permease subunit
MRAFFALALLVLVFSLLSPSFLTAANAAIMAKHVAINVILGLGMTFVIISGGIDLSVGATAGLAGMIVGGVVHEGIGALGVGGQDALYVLAPAALLTGAAVGAVNGWLVARLSVPPFVATLGTLYAVRGLALLRSDGATFPDLAGADGTGPMAWLGSGSFLGLSTPVYVALLLALVSGWLMRHRPFGRYIYAVGGNERAATLAGVPVLRTKFKVYIMSGICAAMAGLVIAAQLQAAHPATGEGFELGAIAAVVLGGASLAGGVGTVVGTLIGATVVGVLDDGLVLLGVSEFWQMVVKGSVIVLAVVSERLTRRL